MEARLTGSVSHPLAFVALAGLLCASACSTAPKEAAPPTAELRKATNEPALSAIRQITFAGLRSGEGYLDSSGNRMVFQSEREPGNPFYQIYLFDLRTGAERRVSTGIGKSTCGWIHPNGSQVLFSSTHLDPHAERKQKGEYQAREAGRARRYSWDFDSQYDLFVRDLQSDGLRQLAPAPGYDAEASWSPDGRWIVFASNRHAYARNASISDADAARLGNDPSGFVDLYLADAQGRNVRRLTDTPGYDGGPFFSANGRMITWRRFSEDGTRAEIYTMTVDGGEPTQITHLGAMSWAPFFHPSGDYIVFTTNVHGMKNFELYAVDTRGEHDPVRITHHDGFDGLPSFSKDGKSLTWTSHRGGSKRSQIFLADWDDARVRERIGLPPLPDSSVAPTLEVPADSRPSIEAADLRAHVDALTSDAADGRLTGTPGERIATGYVARVFRAIGLEPAGDNGTFYQDFGFTAGVSMGKDNSLAWDRAGEPTSAWTVDQDWRPLAFSETGDFGDAPAVFVGYGVVAAEDGAPALDGYGDLDVEGKWVVALRDLPSGLSKEARGQLRRHSTFRSKAMIARDRGARGILFVAGPHSRVRNQLTDLRFDASLAGTSIAAATVTDQVAEALLSRPDESLSQLQLRFDETPESVGFALGDVALRVQIDLRQQRRKGRNVIGRLRLSDDPNHETILVGAHVDHLGRGRNASSLAKPDDDGVHRGADDNASGVAALLEAAQQLAHRHASGALDAARDIEFAAWSGEELGLLGSNHFVTQLTDESNPHAGLSKHIAAYLNLDMVGRLEEQLFVYGVGSSEVWPLEIERANAPLGLSVVARPDSYLATDATSFTLAGVPILSAFTGVHEDYHRPSDTADKLDYEGLRLTTELVTRLSASLAQREEAPKFVATDRPKHAGVRSGLSVYVGSIPDYAHTEANGVRLSGVAAGGPAEKAGMRAGDVIVEVGGHVIENLYDYTFALGELTIAESTPVTVMRGGERVSLTVVPESRE